MKLFGIQVESEELNWFQKLRLILFLLKYKRTVNKTSNEEIAEIGVFLEKQLNAKEVKFIKSQGGRYNLEGRKN